MNIDELKNAILIIKDKAKDTVLKKINDTGKLINVKIFTLSELKKNYFFDYDKEAIYYVSRKYNVRCEIAKIYLDNLYYIKDIPNKKIEFLLSLKEDLENKKLLKKNELFKPFLKGKKVILYNLSRIDLFYENLFLEIGKFCDIERYEDKKEISTKTLIKCQNKEEEIAYIASEIVKLIKNGIDINKIKLANVQSDYVFEIEKTFRAFNIPVELPSTSSIEGTLLVKKFKEFLAPDVHETFDKIKEYVVSKEDEKLYKKLIDIANDYAWSNDYLEVKDLIIADIKNISMNKGKYKNAVRVIDFPEDIIGDDEYVFLINFNQGVIPANAKDEEYLSDDIKTVLGVSTSVDINTKNKLEVQNKIGTTKNLVVTYSTHNLTSELYISPAFKQDLFLVKDADVSYSESNAYNKWRLTSLKDENKKFGTVSNELFMLDAHYKDEPYDSYDNKFSGLNKEKLNEYLKGKLTLSYSTMNTYYECAFRYYLDNILKVGEYEDTFQTLIGNIFHKILSECFVDSYDFEYAWNREIKNASYEFSKSEEFFLSILKEELIFIIETIKKQMEKCSLDKALYENRVVVEIDKEKNIVFKGFIDKLLYGTFDGETIAVIIDYKTGNPELSLDNVPYGLDMQLPVYIYLVKNKVQNVRIGGFYLQKILNNIKNKEDKIASLKLQGYSNSDKTVLEKVDSTYINSEIIKSLRSTDKGFYNYSKVLSDDNMDTLVRLVQEKIREAASDIMDAKFDINPKQIGDALVGCKYCKYKDICYYKNSDIVKYRKIKKNEFLGGEDNAKVD